MQSTSEFTKITIKYNNDSKHVIVKGGVLKKAVLQEYYTHNGTLTYEIGGETYLLDTDGENIYINPEIDIYQFNDRDECLPAGGKKRKRFQDMLDDLYQKNDLSDKVYKKKLTTQKVCNKKQDSKDNIAQPFRKRVLYRVIR